MPRSIGQRIKKSLGGLSPRWAFFLPLITGLSGGGLYVDEVADRQRSREEATNQAELNSAAARFQDRILANSAVLSTIASSIPEMSNLDAEAFARLTKPLVGRAEGIEVAELVVTVPASERAKFEEICLNGNKVRDVPGSTTAPAAEPRERSLVTFVEPFEGNQRVIGLDLRSEDVRSLVLDRADASGNTEFSTPLNLLQDAKTNMSLIAAHVSSPIRLKGFPPMKGYVVALLRFPAIVNQANLELRRCKIIRVIQVDGHRKRPVWESEETGSNDLIKAPFIAGKERYLVEATLVQTPRIWGFTVFMAALCSLATALLVGFVGRSIALQRVAEERHRRELQELAAELLERESSEAFKVPKP